MNGLPYTVSDLVELVPQELNALTVIMPVLNEPVKSTVMLLPLAGPTMVAPAGTDQRYPEIPAAGVIE